MANYHLRTWTAKGFSYYPSYTTLLELRDALARHQLVPIQ